MNHCQILPQGTARQRSQYARPVPPFLAQSSARLRELGTAAPFLAWELVQMCKGLNQEEEQALAYLILASLQLRQDGSTLLPLADEHVLATILHELEAPEAVLRTIHALVEEVKRTPGPDAGRARTIMGMPGEDKPLILQGTNLYHHRLLLCEERLIARLRTRLGGTSPFESRFLEGALATVLAHPTVKGGNPVVLSKEQHQAVRLALRSSLSIISGGPGTGKTSIVVSMLRTCARMGCVPQDVALAAPTGKAANRMWQSIQAAMQSLPEPDDTDHHWAEQRPAPQTLHRLLGFSPRLGRFMHHQGNPLTHRLVIVDEGSMIDLFLMDALLQAVRADACLVLLGDADQLPSVDAGAVFRDLVVGKFPCSTRLTESYRMKHSDPGGQAILGVAGAIHDGKHDAALQGMLHRSSAEELVFDKVELLHGQDERNTRVKFLDRWYHHRIGSMDGWTDVVQRVYRVDGSDSAELERLFKHLESSRLLCITRAEGFVAGAEHTNAIMHARHQSALRAQGHGDWQEESGMVPGEPIMMQHNDHERELFNGDQGVVLRVAQPSGHAALMVVFRGTVGFRAFPLETLRSALKVCFAMTVHKAQGSEFDCVGILLPEVDMGFLTREILYTAVTRSRSSVVLVGARERLLTGMTRTIHRYCGVAQGLQAVPIPQPGLPTNPPVESRTPWVRVEPEGGLVDAR